MTRFLNRLVAGVTLLMAVLKVCRGILINKDRPVPSFSSEHVPPPQPIDGRAPGSAPES
jgi:hypothetical protein